MISAKSGVGQKILIKCYSSKFCENPFTCSQLHVDRLIATAKLIGAFMKLSVVNMQKFKTVESH